MSADWIADRMHHIDASGIRKVFDLAAGLQDPINLSIGQPHFPMPEPVADAICDAVRNGKTGYSQTQGIAPLREALQADVDQLGHADRQAFLTSGTSGGLMLSLSVLVNPRDEVIIFDPYFVMYKHLIRLAGGTPVMIETEADFSIDLDRVREAITDRTKAIILNSPANPTGYVATEEEVRGLAELSLERDICLISDEIYSAFCYARPFISPTQYNPQTLVIDGFSKSHAMTGLRLGWAHGPAEVIQQMIKLQQFTFVCAPHPVQYGGLAARDVDLTPYVDDYREKQAYVTENLHSSLELPGGMGAFYRFIPVRSGTGTEFVEQAIAKNLLIIPGKVFSERDTHFRISYAAEWEVLQRGIEVINSLVDELGW